MALITLESKSEALGKSTTVRIILPDWAKPPYPTLYLLHGLSDNESIWTRRTALERYAENYPFLIVMPDGGRFWYSDTLLSKCETFIATELVDYVDCFLPTRRQRRYRAIGGLSMGGYGAMKIGLKHSRRFGAVACHSSAFFPPDRQPKEFTDDPGLAQLASPAFEPDGNVYILAEKCPTKSRPAIYFDCGRQDFLFTQNEAFDRHLRRLRVPHTYKRFDGEHNWAYWDTHIQDALRFFARTMRLGASASRKAH